MFIVVKYGDNKECLFNPNCKTRLLLENIKDRCQFPREIEIDLSDELGNLKNLSQASPQYANEILTKEREKLVLIEIRRNTPLLNETVVDGQYKRLGVPTPLNDADVTYIPLLNDQKIVTADFRDQLSRRGTPAVAEGKGKKKRNKRNSDTLNHSMDKASLELLSAQQSMPSSTSLKGGGSGKGSRRGSVTNQNRSKSRGRNK